ncbi:TorD/DmsD family molecular chaperone [Arcanobacterium ihumii]|uniref:TorD/DmsD family molecular chaperone n=1 Tax=Arcanobacterium ihumii TaxID=2138162 RepID=UPI00135B8089|nr:molecular chaperone TorD family protein [Arcanobacterium ihumii]
MNHVHLEALATSFSTLARLHLTAPTPEILEELKTLYTQWPLQEEFTGKSTLPETITGLSEWNKSFENSEDAGDIADDLNLLYGRTATAKIAPYESVHRGQDGLVFDVQTLEVRDLYRELNLQAPNLNREPDDHIGLEFDFIAQVLTFWLTALDNNAPSDAERYRNAVVTFYKDHASLWIPTFLTEAHELADSLFIRGLLSISLGAVKELESGLMES